MSKLKIAILAISAAILFGCPLSARALDIKAFVDRTDISYGESLTLTVSVNGEDGAVDVSPIQDFKVVSSGTSTSVQVINSRVSREKAFTYTLIPLREGSLRIPPLNVLSGGNTYNTQEIIIHVSKELAKSGDNEDVFVEATVSNLTPYEGQQIVYTFKVYQAVQIANANFRQPDFSGFSVKKIDEKKSYTGVFSGKRYNVTELTFVLIPLSAGKTTIKPGVLTCDVIQRIKRNRDPFFDSFFNDRFFGRTQLESRVLNTRPIEVNVKPLPEYQGQVKFSGLVGEFDIRTSFENTELHVGDSATLSITIEGTGNIADAEAPQIEFPKTCKVYPDNPEEDIHLGASGYSGRKTFRFALVPTMEGQHTLPPIQLRYFDVSKGQYRIRSTNPISITVHPAKTANTLEVFSAPVPDKRPSRKKVEFTGHDILPLKEELDALSSRRTLGPIPFLLCLAAPFLCFLLAKTLTAFRGENNTPSRIMAQRAEKALKDARCSKVSGEEFLSCLYRAVVSAIFSQAGVKGESLTCAEAQEILKKKGFPEEMSARASNLLEKIEAAKFSGIQMDGDFSDKLYSEAREMIRSLSK